MTRIAFGCLLVLASLIGTVQPASAQVDGTGPVSAPVIDATGWPLAGGDCWRYRVRRIERRPGEDAVFDDSAQVRVLASWLHGSRRIAVLERNRPDFDEATPRRSSDAAGPPAPRVIEIEYQVLESGRVTIGSDPGFLGPFLKSGRLEAAAEPPAADALGEVPLPLLSGIRWGPPEMLARSDGLYAASAGAPTRLELPIGPVTAVAVSYRTLPDREDRWLAAGLGLVRRQYRHHGLDLLETWELSTFTHEAVDTLALAGRLERRLRQLLDGEAIWSRRSTLPADPELNALLGPVAAAETPEDEDGVRHLFLRGSAGLVSLERIPDGSGRAWLVQWSLPGGARRRFHVASEAGPATGGVRGTLDLGSVHDLFREARRAVTPDNGTGATRAAVWVEAAMQLLTERLLAVAPAPTADRDAAESWRRALGAVLGESVLVTRYGPRLRLDDDDLRVDLEVLAGAWAVTARQTAEDGTSIGGAPRFVHTGEAPLVLVDPADPSGGLAPRRWLTLDWSPARPAREALILSEGPTGIVRRLDLFQIDADGARRGWTRLLAAGRVRLHPDSGRLDIDSERPDPRLAAAAQRWRESYGPPESAEVHSPTPLRWERIDSWLDAGVAVVMALRRRPPGPIEGLVRGDGLPLRLSSTWLARPDVEIARVESFHRGIDGEFVPAVAAITFRRAPAAGPTEAEATELSLRLVREAGSWVIVDLVSGPAGDPDWEP